MATNRPDPGEFFDLAQRMLRELFGEPGGDDEPWAEATRRPRERSGPRGAAQLSPTQQRENLTFALATRAVEALEDWRSTSRRSVSASNARSRRPPGARPENEARGPDGADAAG